MSAMQGERDLAAESATVRSSIVLIEDHAILREGLRALLELEADLEVVGEAGNGADGIRVVRQLRPQLVITDIALPGGSGLRTIAELRGADPELQVMVLTAHCTDEYIRAALHAGAAGYILKDATRGDLIRGVRAVLAGQQYLSAPVSSRVVSGYLNGHGGRHADDPSGITEREREVLRLIALGDSNKRIALVLNLSVKTIEKHRANLMRKLSLHNAAAVTLYAVKAGVLTSDEAATKDRRLPSTRD